MDGWLDALPWLTGGLVLAAALVVLRRPVEWLLGAALRTGVGLAVLYALSGVGGLAGFTWGSIWSTPWCWACWERRGSDCC